MAATARAAGPVEWGVKAGINVTAWMGEESRALPAAELPNYGLVAGEFAYVPLTRVVGIQAELLYSGKGAKYGGANVYHSRLDYIEIPVLIALTPQPDAGAPYARVLVGPAFGILVGSTLRTDGGGPETGEITTQTDLGLTIGAGWSFPFRRAGAVSLDVRGTIGLRAVGDGAAESDRVRNAAFSIATGYSF